MTTMKNMRLKQIDIYLRRYFRMFQNNHGWKIFLSVVLISVLVSMVTGEDMFRLPGETKSGSFAWVSACIWIGIFNSIRTVCGEREIVKREHRTGLYISSYMLSHWFFEAVLCLAEAFIISFFICIFNFNALLKNDVGFGRMLLLFITCWLIVFASDTMGLMISCIVHTENTAMTVMPFALIIQLIMAGMIFELKGFTKVVSVFTVSRWGLDAFLVVTNFEKLGWFVADEYRNTIGNLVMYWGLLVIFSILYLVIGGIFLSLIDRSER